MNPEIALSVDFHLYRCSTRQPLITAFMDNLTITSVPGCSSSLAEKFKVTWAREVLLYRDFTDSKDSS